MSSQSRFSDPAYIAWLRDTLALLYLKEGIEDITEAVAKTFHDNLEKGLRGSACTSCYPRNMIKDIKGQRWYMKCPVCDPWLKRIVSKHRCQPLPNIFCNNTKPQLWPTHRWEVLKCYMGNGCQGIQSAKVADTQNLLKLFQNCPQFDTGGQITRMDLIDELLEIRNSLFHSGDMHVDETELKKHMQIMLDFLAGVTPKSKAVTDAVSKITELQNDSIDLSLASNKDLELRALQQKQNALDQKQQELKQETDTAVGALQQEQQELKQDTNIAVRTLQTEQQELKQETNTAVRTLQTEQQELKQETNTAVRTLQTEQQELKQETNTAVRTLQTEQQELKQETNTAVRTLQTEQQELKQDTNIAVRTLQTEQQELKQETHTAVRTLQTEHQTMLVDIGAMKSDIASKSASTKRNMQTSANKITDLESWMKQVQADQDQFKKFLQDNNLEQDLSRLSTRIEQLETRITSLEQHSQRSQQGPCEVAEDDIAGLRSKLVKHYRGGQSLLVPNPVVDEALDLDEIYVRPDIKVLRETSNPRAGLKTVQTNSTAGSGSMCKNLFYTDQYQNKQIYVAGNAGVGKTVLCKYLVNLWCQTQSESQQVHKQNQDSRLSVDLSTSQGFLSPGASTEQYEETSQYVAPDTGSGSLNPGHSPDYSIFTDTGEIDSSSESESDTSDSDEDYFWSEQAFYVRARKRAEKMKQEEDADREIIAEFPLLFYISLRESSKHYTVANMIDAQILKQIQGLSHLKAADILQKTRCLVIVDGLDEWACPEDAEIPPFINPGIPGRDLNSNSVFLTTTRPWKLDVLGLKGLEIDKHVELCGLNKRSSKELCSKYIDFVNKLDGTNKKSQSFSAELKKKGLKRFNKVPNLLILLIGLWMDNQDLGQSRLQLFCSMLEMLLKRAAEKNLPQQRSNDSITTERLLPECFNNRPHCLIHQQLLAHLCKVAFEALLDPKREDALVFNASQLTIFGVNQDGIDLCLKSGILTQDKVLGKRSVTEKKISFLHKQLQEVLAAVYISNRENKEQVTSRVYDFCTTVESVLELSQVWMFVSGIRPVLLRELLTELMTRVVLNDDQLHQYRSSMDDYDTAFPMSIQTCIVDCVMEARSNGHGDLPLPLHDFVINNNTISACLEYLVTTNTSAIKSVYISTRSITGDKVQTVESIVTQLQHTSCLQTLYLVGEDSVVSDTSPLHKALVNNKDTLTCLVLHYITLSPELHAAVCGSLHHLTSLLLWAVSLTHKQEEQLLSSVSQAGSMRELGLRLCCTEHGDQCRPGIDLSGLPQLHRLHLTFMNVAQLPAVVPCVEEVYLLGVTVAESQLRQFIHQLSSTSHSVTVKLGWVTVTGENENPVDLTDLTHNSKLHVTCCNNYDSNNTWSIDFSTLQQTTSESDN